MSDDLEPIDPETAVELYLDHREPELSEKSLQNHTYRLDTFLDFCEEHGIDDLNTLTGRDLHLYRTWRNGDDITKITLRTHLATLRVFLEFAASIDAVEPGLREKVVLPDLDREDEARSIQLEEGDAERILDYLQKFEYASRAHVVLSVLWHTGIRVGTLRSFDLDDWDPEAPCLRVRHRPESGTPLKNGAAADRTIAVGEYYAEVIEDYIAYNRPDVTDEFGREPLLTTVHGRVSEGSLRNTVYRWTRPCVTGVECPHDRDPDTCEAMESGRASTCPSSRNPHSVRRGALTRMLREGVPEEVVGGRANVSDDVLEQHYDERSERERMEQRRDFLPDT